MRVRVKAKLPALVEESNAPLPDYPLRTSSFAFSVGVHSSIAALLFLLSVPSPSARRPIYDEFIKPNEHKIIFYDFRRKIPDVNHAKKLGSSRDPRGAELSKQTIVVSSPKPKSTQVLLSVPIPKIQINQDLPTPILVASMETVAPPPMPERPKPKVFVPPPPAPRPPKLPIQTPVLDMQTPSLPAQSMSAPVPLTRLIYSATVAPPKNAPESPTPHAGTAKADIAAASLHPVESADTPVPNGERPGQFSKAPVKGEASSGDASNTAALTVPDLTIRNPKPEPAPVPTREVLYTERVRGIPLATLSVPLRPSSRMIPAAVDAKFKGRNVYTIVIPMERIAAYSGDWILWFADRSSRAGDTPVVRAPMPYRKVEPVEQAPMSSRIKERIRFSARLGKSGKLDGIALLTDTTAAIQRAVFEDVTSWQFQPATCDGVAVEIDVVFEIPFNLPPAPAGGPTGNF